MSGAGNPTRPPPPGAARGPPPGGAHSVGGAARPPPLAGNRPPPPGKGPPAEGAQLPPPGAAGKNRGGANGPYGKKEQGAEASSASQIAETRGGGAAPAGRSLLQPPGAIANPNLAAVVAGAAAVSSSGANENSKKEEKSGKDTNKAPAPSASSANGSSTNVPTDAQIAEAVAAGDTSTQHANEAKATVSLEDLVMEFAGKLKGHAFGPPNNLKTAKKFTEKLRPLCREDESAGAIPKRKESGHGKPWQWPRGTNLGPIRQMIYQKFISFRPRGKNAVAAHVPRKRQATNGDGANKKGPPTKKRKKGVRMKKKGGPSKSRDSSGSSSSDSSSSSSSSRSSSSVNTAEKERQKEKTLQEEEQRKKKLEIDMHVVWRRNLLEISDRERADREMKVKKQIERSNNDHMQREMAEAPFFHAAPNQTIGLPCIVYEYKDFKPKPNPNYAASLPSGVGLGNHGSKSLWRQDSTAPGALAAGTNPNPFDVTPGFLEGHQSGLGGVTSLSSPGAGGEETGSTFGAMTGVGATANGAAITPAAELQTAMLTGGATSSGAGANNMGDGAGGATGAGGITPGGDQATTPAWVQQMAATTALPQHAGAASSSSAADDLERGGEEAAEEAAFAARLAELEKNPRFLTDEFEEETKTVRIKTEYRILHEPHGATRHGTSRAGCSWIGKGQFGIVYLAWRSEKGVCNEKGELIPNSSPADRWLAEQDKKIEGARRKGDRKDKKIEEARRKGDREMLIRLTAERERGPPAWLKGQKVAMKVSRKKITDDPVSKWMTLGAKLEKEHAHVTEIEALCRKHKALCMAKRQNRYLVASELLRRAERRDKVRAAAPAAAATASSEESGATPALAPAAGLAPGSPAANSNTPAGQQLGSTMPADTGASALGARQCQGPSHLSEETMALRRECKALREMWADSEFLCRMLTNGLEHFDYEQHYIQIFPYGVCDLLNAQTRYTSIIHDAMYKQKYVVPTNMRIPMDGNRRRFVNLGHAQPYTAYESHASLVAHEYLSREALQNVGFPVHIAGRFAQNILHALRFLKTVGYIHTDLKPENIMVHYKQPRAAGSPGWSGAPRNALTRYTSSFDKRVAGWDADSMEARNKTFASWIKEEKEKERQTKGGEVAAVQHGRQQSRASTPFALPSNTMNVWTEGEAPSIHLLTPDAVEQFFLNATAKLADLGEVQRAPIIVPQANANPKDNIQPPWYRAPEVYMGDWPLTPAIDMWSAAVTFWSIFVGGSMLFDSNLPNRSFPHLKHLPHFVPPPPKAQKKYHLQLILELSGNCSREIVSRCENVFNEFAYEHDENGRIVTEQNNAEGRTVKVRRRGIYRGTTEQQRVELGPKGSPGSPLVREYFSLGQSSEGLQFHKLKVFNAQQWSKMVTAGQIASRPNQPGKQTLEQAEQSATLEIDQKFEPPVSLLKKFERRLAVPMSLAKRLARDDARCLEVFERGYVTQKYPTLCDANVYDYDPANKLHTSADVTTQLARAQEELEELKNRGGEENKDSAAALDLAAEASKVRKRKWWFDVYSANDKQHFRGPDVAAESGESERENGYEQQQVGFDFQAEDAGAEDAAAAAADEEGNSESSSSGESGSNEEKSSEGGGSSEQDEEEGSEELSNSDEEAAEGEDEEDKGNNDNEGEEEDGSISVSKNEEAPAAGEEQQAGNGEVDVVGQMDVEHAGAAAAVDHAKVEAPGEDVAKTAQADEAAPAADLAMVDAEPEAAAAVVPALDGEDVEMKHAPAPPPTVSSASAAAVVEVLEAGRGPGAALMSAVLQPAPPLPSSSAAAGLGSSASAPSAPQTAPTVPRPPAPPLSPQTAFAVRRDAMEQDKKEEGARKTAEKAKMTTIRPQLVGKLEMEFNDLLKKMIILDKNQRIDPDAALRHEFFETLRRVHPEAMSHGIYYHPDEDAVNREKKERREMIVKAAQERKSIQRDAEKHAAAEWRKSIQEEEHATAEVYSAPQAIEGAGAAPRGANAQAQRGPPGEPAAPATGTEAAGHSMNAG
eukprot:CAMPEP_0178997710 /NCGR_PEP_ID=MMETSP0795-20121207/9106_1 /TAXON_ID=88552 /ORGANISM="Amoebophrya sp., Strain Ameob2" /LENGTH=2001 /DNA_ID=CAMNT_0020690303 /DNA_START=121 /DNA_END=6128 /DNA_ORIENTATION=+